MKLISSLFILLLSFNAFASSSGKALENSVVKMGVCVGVNDDEGKEYVFSEEGFLNIRYPGLTWGEYCSQYASEYGAEYASEYCASEEWSSVTVSVPAAWEVKNKSVLIYQGEDVYSLAIGFKSKTCWAQ